MGEVTLGEGRALLVASRGTAPHHGLWRFTHGSGAWQGAQLAAVGQLSALCRHPALPVVYGSGGAAGRLHAWRLEGGGATPLGEAPAGADPCHLAADPSGRMLVAANYGSSDLTIVPLAGDGGFAGPPVRLPLAGSGPDRDRQDAAHPHQVLFQDGLAFVIDLGSDRIRRFAVDAATLVPLDAIATPPGAGPRHAVFLPGGRVAIADELAAALTVGSAGPPAGWASVASSRRSGPARTRSRRNYPGDIERAADGRHVYLANRGHDTIAAFDVDGVTPRLAAEVDAGVRWPQHLLVLGDHLLVAGWDSDEVTALPLAAGLPGRAERLFPCAAPGWLLLVEA